MIFQVTKIQDLYIIKLEAKEDKRGYFMRTFCKEEFSKNNIQCTIVQINQSLTKEKGTIRGMHFQKEPKSEDKIIQCLKGAVYDVSVDLRKDSLTYGQWIAEELTEKNKKTIFIPKGFAHGFQALTNNCLLQYFMSEYYSPEYSAGFRWNDPTINIKWPIKNPKLSEKDKKWPLFNK